MNHERHMSSDQRQTSGYGRLVAERAANVVMKNNNKFYLKPTSIEQARNLGMKCLGDSYYEIKINCRIRYQ